VHVIAAVLIGTGLLLVLVAAAAWGGYLYGRTVEQPERESAEEFAEAMSAGPWTPPERPLPPRYDPRDKVEPIPPGVWGMPIGTRQPILAQAFVGGGGKRVRPEGVEPSPVLRLAIEHYTPGPGAITREFQRIVQEVERV
jgi:hypothetical protein